MSELITIPQPEPQESASSGVEQPVGATPETVVIAPEVSKTEVQAVQNSILATATDTVTQVFPSSTPLPAASSPQTTFTMPDLRSVNVYDHSALVDLATLIRKARTDT